MKIKYLTGIYLLIEAEDEQHAIQQARDLLPTGQKIIQILSREATNDDLDRGGYER